MNAGLYKPEFYLNIDDKSFFFLQNIILVRSKKTSSGNSIILEMLPKWKFLICGRDTRKCCFPTVNALHIHSFKKQFMFALRTRALLFCFILLTSVTLAFENLFSNGWVRV